MQELVCLHDVITLSIGEENLDIDSKMLLRFANMEKGLLSTYASIHTLSTQVKDDNYSSPPLSDSEVRKRKYSLSLQDD